MARCLSAAGAKIPIIPHSVTLPEMTLSRQWSADAFAFFATAWGYSPKAKVAEDVAARLNS
jgi:hypothetical protein